MTTPQGQLPTDTNTASGAADSDDSLMLCASDLQHIAIYDNHVEMQSCLRAVADRIAVLARASHGQAPAETGNSVSAQADSVQEDAARLDWLEQNLFHREKDEWDTKFGGYKEYNMWVLFSPKGIRGRARDIIDAARKQGEKQ